MSRLANVRGKARSRGGEEATEMKAPKKFGTLTGPAAAGSVVI